MGCFQELYKKTKNIVTMYTGIFVVIMFLNQLLFFGFCLNPVCLIAAMPHVLFITVLVGVWVHKPTYKKISKSLKSVRESYDEVKKQIERHRQNQKNQEAEDLFTGNVYLFVTQNPSKGEKDFETVLGRYKKPKIVTKVRLNNQHKSKALLKAIVSVKHNFISGDIVAIVRGGGDTSDSQFDSYKDIETCNEIRNLEKTMGVITVSGIGHSTDNFPIEKAVNFAQITPTDAAMQVAFLIDGRKW